MKARKRYYKDSAFHKLVDGMVECMVNCVAELQFTPTGIRNAAMLACMFYEEGRLPDLGCKVKSDEPGHRINGVEESRDNPSQPMAGEFVVAVEMLMQGMIVNVSPELKNIQRTKLRNELIKLIRRLS